MQGVMEVCKIVPALEMVCIWRVFFVFLCPHVAQRSPLAGALGQTKEVMSLHTVHNYLMEFAVIGRGVVC